MFLFLLNILNVVLIVLTGIKNVVLILYRSIQVHLNKLECREKVIFFL